MMSKEYKVGITLFCVLHARQNARKLQTSVISIKYSLQYKKGASLYLASREKKHRDNKSPDMVQSCHLILFLFWYDDIRIVFF